MTGRQTMVIQTFLFGRNFPKNENAENFLALKDLSDEIDGVSNVLILGRF